MLGSPPAPFRDHSGGDNGGSSSQRESSREQPLGTIANTIELGDLLVVLPSPLFDQAEVAFGEGAAWTAVNWMGVGELLRVDAPSDVAQSTARGRIPFAVAVGFGAVWVSDLVASPEKWAKPEPGEVVRIDPATSTLDDVINVGKSQP